MFQDDPIFSIVSLAISAYLFYMWVGDFNFFKKSQTLRKGAFEGATTVSCKLLVIASVSALCLLSIITYAEFALGVHTEQTEIAPWALLSWLGAAFVEELIFRGYLVVKNKGRAMLVLSIVFFSIIFAVAHPFVWNYEVAEGESMLSGVWTFDFTTQPILNTFAILCCSLLFYTLRFVPANINKSILPCIVAHASYNCGVFAIKCWQGFVQW